MPEHLSDALECLIRHHSIADSDAPRLKFISDWLQSPLRKPDCPPQHIQDLQDIGRLLKNSGEVQNTNQLMKVLKVGTKIAVGGPATAGAGWGASAVLGKIMTDADAAAKAMKFLRSSVIPRTMTNAYRQLHLAAGRNSSF